VNTPQTTAGSLLALGALGAGSTDALPRPRPASGQFVTALAFIGSLVGYRRKCRDHGLDRFPIVVRWSILGLLIGITVAVARAMRKQRMARPALTIATFIALTAALAAGAALHFDDWAWYVGGLAAGVLVTLTDRRAFYGRASALALADSSAATRPRRPAPRA
jgi:O-antigen/teichoic acid export membrane protein